jgi:methyltransferase (TIGR00027 family)
VLNNDALNNDASTENDTFDISTGAGFNSLFVAAARALEAHRADPLALDPYAELFCRAVGGSWADLLDGNAPDHRLESEFGEVFQTFLAARTKFFDDYFRHAADDGVRQIVILAAGLDSRAYRLTWPPGTVIFELDQPEVLEFKRAVLADHGAAPAAERRAIAVDLREEWPKALQDNGFEPGVPSAWLAEGIMMYLPGSAQEQLFRGIDALAGQGSYVALEEMQPVPADVLEAKRAEEHAEGEQPGQFFSLIPNELHRPAADWFDEHGWDATAVVAADYISQVGRPVPPPDTDGGQMVGSGSFVTAKKTVRRT